MKKIKPISIFLIGIFVLVNVNYLNGQNSSGWRGDNGNGIVNDFNTPTNWPDELKKDWQVPVGEGDASPVLINNKLYVFVKADNSETVLCLDVAQGKELWRTAVNPSPVIEGPASGHPGPRSTPFVSEEKIYTLGAGGVFSCLNANTGEVIWKNDAYKEVPRFYTSCSPLVIDNICVVQLGGTENGVVVAFEADTGNEIWKLEGVPCTYSSPSLMKTLDQVILVQSETDLLGVSLKGQILWKIATPVERRSYNAPSPVYVGETVVIAGQGSGTKAFSIKKTGSSWESNELWANSELGTSFCTPLIKNGFLFANDARLGKLYCLDMKTGATSWVNDETLNRFASVLDVGNALVSLPASGKLIVFEANGKEYKELANYQVAETEVYGHPILTANNIIVKDKEMLTCWGVK